MATPAAWPGIWNPAAGSPTRNITAPWNFGGDSAAGSKVPGTPYPGMGAPGMIPGGGGGGVPMGSMAAGMSPAAGADTSQPSGPGIIPYKPGPITTAVNDLLLSAIGGYGPGSAVGGLLRGQIPGPIEKQFLQNQELENAAITEQMGVTGNRFGTDLARTLADAAARGQVNLSAEAMKNVLGAFGEISGLGTAQSGLEFAGNQAALDRANQDFLASQQQSGDTFASILPFLLSISGGA